jgi:hypothetical protein
LCVRVDALRENTDGTIGSQNKAYIEARIKQLENNLTGISKNNGEGKKVDKFVKQTNKGNFNSNNDVHLNNKTEKNLLNKKRVQESSSDESDEDEIPIIKKKPKKSL